MKPRFPTLALALAAVVAAACGGESSSADTDTRSDSAGGLVEAPSEPYRAMEVGSSAALVVTLVGDSAATQAPAPTPCAAAGTPQIQTVFWVDGLREGKPLPDERRYELVNGSCGLEPRLQATVIGGAINVFNDAGAHRLVFVRAGTVDTLQVMPFTHSGSVVATDRLTRIAGIVEVGCSQHPSERAYIAVFDHPYFGVASSGDKVTLDAIPPGDYRVMTWHEGQPAPVAVAAKVNGSGQTEIVLH